MAEERTLMLIKERIFVAGRTVKLFASAEDWNKPEAACPTTQAIYNHFQTVHIPGDHHPFPTLSFASYFRHSDELFSIKFSIWKDDAKFLCGLLTKPFIHIRIDGKKDDEDINSESYFVLDKTLALDEMLDPESVEDRETHHTMTIPLPNDMVLNVGASLQCNISLEWKEISKPVQLCTGSLMKKLHEDESTMDLIIVAANRAEIKCHKLIFGAQSPAFSGMVSAKTGMKEALSNRVELIEYSEVGLRQLVSYMYGGRLVIGETFTGVELELFELAHKYGLEGLESSLLELFLKKDAKWFTPDDILELHLYVKKVDVFGKLREHTLAVMAGMRPQLLRCEEFGKLDKAQSVGLLATLMDYYEKHLGMQKLNPQGGKGVKRRRGSSEDDPQN